MDQKCQKILVFWVILHWKENKWYGNEIKEKLYVISIYDRLIKIESNNEEYYSFYWVSFSECCK